MTSRTPPALARILLDRLALPVASLPAAQPATSTPGAPPKGAEEKGAETNTVLVVSAATPARSAVSAEGRP